MSNVTPQSVAEILKGLLGNTVKNVPIVGALVDLADDPDVVTALSGLTANGIAELQAQFDSARKMSPAARQAFMDSLTPEMMNRMLDADRERIEKVELDQAKVDEALAKATRKIFERLVTEAIKLLV